MPSFAKSISGKRRNANTIAPFLLRAIECPVSGAHERCEIAIRSAGACHAKAASDRQLPAFDVHGNIRNRLTQTLTQFRCLIAFAVWKHEKEFLAAYCRHSGRQEIPHWPFFLAFSFFRMASITQGVYARALQGNAADPRAIGYGDSAKQFSRTGWAIASGQMG